MEKILFVCHGNICRSPMAEFVMKKFIEDEGLSNVYVESAATSTEELGNGMHRGTIEILQKYNIPYSKHRARQITKEDYNTFDYIIGMDGENLYYMNRRWNNDPENKITLLLHHANINRDVADPWYTGNFEQTYEDICTGCSALLNLLKNK